MNFDSKAEIYQENASIQKMVAKWTTSFLDPAECAGKRALEFGAGCGFLTEHLVKLDFASLEATDVSPAMVALGRRRVPQAHWSPENAWEPRPRDVDWLFASSLLQWAPSPNEILSRWRQLLVPGARLAVSLFVKGSLENLCALDPAFTAINWRTDEEWRTIFESIGWKLRRSSHRVGEERFDSLRSALRSLHSIGATSKNQMPVGTLRRLLQKSATSCFNLQWKTLYLEYER